MNNLSVSCNEVEEKKTLMGAIDRLHITINYFEELSSMSEKMVAKFERTEDFPVKSENTILNKPEQPNIVDLLYNINDRLNLQLNKIGSNVEKVISIID